MRLAKISIRPIGNTVRKRAEISFGRSGTSALNHRRSAAAIGKCILFCTRPLPRIHFRPIGNTRVASLTILFGLSGTPCSHSADHLFGLSSTVSADREQSLGLSGTNHRPIGNTSSADQEQTQPAIALSEPISNLLTGGLTFLTPLTCLTTPYDSCQFRYAKRAHFKLVDEGNGRVFRAFASITILFSFTVTFPHRQFIGPRAQLFHERAVLRVFTQIRVPGGGGRLSCWADAGCVLM